MKNNLSPPTPTIQKTNVIYRFKCPLPHGDAAEYIGLTSTTVNKRLASHLQRGSILEHFKDCHNDKPTKKQLTDNTTILDHAPDRYRLFIKEALHIIKIIHLSINSMTISLMSSNYIPTEIIPTDDLH